MQLQKMSVYSYKPLNAAKREIRLLVLEPPRKGKWDDKLRCSLITTTLNDYTHHAASYDAVSYCWGEGPSSGSIFVDGCLLEITENLDTFLRRKRVRSPKQRLWIDAICINQADNKERTEQVELMSMIYRCATRLVIWLGEQADDSQLAMKLVEEFGTRQKVQATVDVEIAALNKFLKRPYWDRIWIVQEIVIGAAGGKADKTQVICGKERITWSCLTSGMNFIESQRKLGRLPILGLQKLLSLEEARRTGATGSLLSWLIKTRNKQSSEDRDKVYGLLGIADLNTGGLSYLRPDYEEPKSRVFGKLAATNIILGQTLEVLRYCRNRSASDIPSWAPDWSVTDSVAPLPAYNYNHSWNNADCESEEEKADNDSQKETASNGQERTIGDEDEGNRGLTNPKYVTELAEQVRSHMNLNRFPNRTNKQARDLWADIPGLSVSEDMRTLTGSGFIWDAIDILSDPFPSDVNEHWENATHFMINVGKCKALLDSLSDYPNPYQTIGERLKSFWRALCADHSGEGEYPKPDYLFQPDEEERRVGFQNWLPPIPKDWVPREPHVSSIWTAPQYRKAVHAYLNLDEIAEEQDFDVAAWEASFPGRRDWLGELLFQVSSARRHGVALKHVIEEVAKSMSMGKELAELWQGDYYDIIISPFQLPCVIPDPFLHLRRNVFPGDVTFLKEKGISTMRGLRPATTTDERAALFPGDYGAERYALGRRFFVSEKGYLGLCPAESRIGDSIALMMDSHIPFILRSEEKGFSVVGETHVQGIMNGEVVNEYKVKGCIPEKIDLV